MTRSSEEEKFKPSPMDIEEIDQEYQNLIKNQDFKTWRYSYLKNLSYFLGESGIERKQLKILAKNGISPVFFNVIAPVVNTILGIAIQTDYGINVSVNHDSDEARECEQGLNQYFFDVMNSSDFSTSCLRAFKDGLIGGLGFCHVCYKNLAPCIEYISPLNIVLNFRDLSPDFKHQNVIFTWEDLPEQEIQLLFSSNEFRKLKFSRQDKDIDKDLSFLAPDLSNNPRYSNRVFMRHGLEIREGYRGYSDGALFYTLDKKIGEELEDWEQIPLTINTITYICQGRILKSLVQDPLVLNGRIPISIFVCNRDTGTIPHGVMNNLTTVQSCFNIALSKSIAYSNSEKTVVQISNLADRAKYEQEPEVFNHPNSVVFLAPEDRISSIRPNDATAQQIGFIRLFDSYLKNTSGLQDESKGIQTNAVSGVAVQHRDINSLRSTSFIFNNFKSFKKNIGEFLLQQLKYNWETDLAVNLREEKTKKRIILNHVVNNSIKNNIALYKWTINIRQTLPDATMKDQEKQFLLELLNSPIASIALQSETLLGLFVNNPKELKKELSMIMEK